MEEAIIRNTVVILFTAFFSLLFWGISLIAPLFWTWWFVIILYFGIGEILK